MNFEILETGSSGNATLIEGRILIDCGIAYSRIEPYAPELQIVLLTHRHSDHFTKSTVRRLARQRPTLRWAGGDWMIGPLLEAGVDRRNIDALDMDSWYTYAMPEGPVKVCAFETQHDVQNCGWRIRRGPNDALFYATDLGSLDGIKAEGYTHYLLEANYRDAELQERMEEKLEAGAFAYESRAAAVHLSWEQATEWLQENMAPWSVWIPMHGHQEREKTDGREENADAEGHG